MRAGAAEALAEGVVAPSWHAVRLVILIGGAFGIIGVVGAWYLTHGAPEISLVELWRILIGAPDGPDQRVAFVVREIRLPRLLLAMLCGGALALAGVIMQDSLRNPIADPSLLGIAQSASLVVAVAILVPGLVPGVALPVLCFGASLVTGTLLVAFARSIRDPVRLILIGVVFSLLLVSLTTIVLLLAPPWLGGGLSQFFTFTTGSVSSGSWDRVGIVWPWLAVAVPIALLVGRALNLLQLGDDMAAGLGMRVTRARLWLFVVAMLLIAPVVSVAGPIAFVALLSPHVARSLLATTNAHTVLPAAAAVGAVVVVLADTAGRLLFFPMEIPAGIWTIAIAGPLAIWLAGPRLRGSQSAAVAGR